MLCLANLNCPTVSSPTTQGYPDLRAAFTYVDADDLGSLIRLNFGVYHQKKTSSTTHLVISAERERSFTEFKDGDIRHSLKSKDEEPREEVAVNIKEEPRGEGKTMLSLSK